MMIYFTNKYTYLQLVRHLQKFVQLNGRFGKLDTELLIKNGNFSTYSMDFGRKIVRLRKDKNLFRADLAKAVGISSAIIGCYEVFKT